MTFDLEFVLPLQHCIEISEKTSINIRNFSKKGVRRGT